MKAIIVTGSKQYTVSIGDKIRVEKLPIKAGDTVELPVLSVIDGKATKVGTPYVPDTTVSAKSLGDGKGKKVIVFKYKPKIDYRKKQGHRQPFTELEIISIGGVVKAKATSASKPAAEKTAAAKPAAKTTATKTTAAKPAAKPAAAKTTAAKPAAKPAAAKTTAAKPAAKPAAAKTTAAKPAAKPAAAKTTAAKPAAKPAAAKTTTTKSASAKASTETKATAAKKTEK